MIAIILITPAVAGLIALACHLTYEACKHLNCDNCNSYNERDSVTCGVCGCTITHHGQLKLNSSRN